ncbi:sugar transferase [Candidatus Omnitrophota bacterium]
MLREKEDLIKWCMILLDALIIVLSFLLAYFIRTKFHVFYKLDLFPSQQVVREAVGIGYVQYLPVMFLIILLWLLMLSLNGMYASVRTKALLDIIWINIKAAFLTLFSFSSLAFALKIHFVSRAFIIILALVSFVLLNLEKWLVYEIRHYVRKKGHNLRYLLIAGTGPRAEKFINIINAHPEWGIEVMGLVDEDVAKVGQKVYGIEIIGTLSNIEHILQYKVIDDVVFIVPRSWLDRIQESIQICETQGVKAHVAADLFNLNIARARYSELVGFPLLTFDTSFAMEWQLLVKRTIDLSVSFFSLIFLSPLFLIVAISIKLASPGPVFFKQRRVGFNGRFFTLFKFRSMSKDAQKKMTEVMHLNEMKGPVFKIKNDPRITPFGRFMRKTSIDELPQLYNILMGHMSLVGPRPPIPVEVNEYELWHRRRLSMRPGLTCLWQISGRNEVDFDEWMRLDLKYLDNWSLWLDFRILVKTIPAVLFGVGAR